MQEHFFQTSGGQIYAVETGSFDQAHPCLLLIHGNSSSHKIFHPLLSSFASTDHFRVLALDLPGHGQSEDAKDASTVYWCPAMRLAFQSGHIALELISLNLKGVIDLSIRGVMLVGTPPSSGQQVSQAFLDAKESPHMALSSTEYFTEDDAYYYAHAAIGHPFEQWQEDDALRTDGRARRYMFEAFQNGSGVDQVRLVADLKDVCVAVVNGATEPFVNLGYVARLQYGNLWRGECFGLPKAGHAPFWENPPAFMTILNELLQDISLT